jgi:hypothetical protein
VLRPLPLVSAAFALVACASEPKPSLLDREYEVYRAEREEARLEDLKSRRAKAQAEADRLAQELGALETQVRERRQRVREAAAAGLRLPDAMRLTDAPGPVPAAAPAPAQGTSR